MARSSPFDKLLIVECLKQKGNVVTVTGDGINDALALKEADIGLSMGIQGTAGAKESSDIVILDNNFASVATVLMWGRYVLCLQQLPKVDSVPTHCECYCSCDQFCCSCFSQ